MRRTSIVLGVLALLGLFAAWLRGPTRPADSVITPAVKGSPATSTQVNVAAANGARVYRFRLAHDSRVEVLGAVQRSGSPSVTVDTKLAFEGTFALWPMGQEGSRRRVQFAFLELPKHELVINGQPVFPTDAMVNEELLPHRAVLLLEFGARPVEVWTSKASPPPFERMVQLLMGELQYNASAGPTFTDVELSALGRVDVAYQQLAATPGVRRLEKRRTRYRTLRPLEQREGLAPAEVSSAAELELDDVAELLHFTGREEVTVARGGVRVLDWRMEVEAQRSDGPAPPPLALSAFQEKRPFGEVTVSERTEAEHLAQRIGDMTKEKMFADLGRFGAGGHMPDHNAWCWRVTGLLRRDPALAQALGEQFWVPALGSPGRGLIVDLLAGAGTPEAQVVLRAILAKKADLSEKEWRRHLQALGQITEPTAETLRFTVDRYAEEQGMDRWASALAMGAVINHRLESKDDPEAKAAADRLLADLEAETDEESRTRLLGALGNAGVADHLPRLLALRADPSNAVREKMAYALRKLDVPEARSALAELTGDPNFGVAVQAINTLDRLSIGEEEIRLVHAQMVAGRIPPEAFPGVVTAFSRSVQHPLVRELFQRIIAHPRTFNELRARCRALLTG